MTDTLPEWLVPSLNALKAEYGEDNVIWQQMDGKAYVGVGVRVGDKRVAFPVSPPSVSEPEGNAWFFRPIHGMTPEETRDRVVFAFKNHRITRKDN